MKFVFPLLFIFSLISCQSEKLRPPKVFSSVKINSIYKDTTQSIRALDIGKEYIHFGSSTGYGKIALSKEFKINLNEFSISNTKNHLKFEHKNTDGNFLNFRAVKQINGDLFALSIESPAKLYRLNRKANSGRLVYEENHPKAFYDAINFWNDKEGIAIGDPTDNCISIIITRDGGETWTKLSCDNLPKAEEGEAAFAASNTNIAIMDEHAWVATGGKASRILYSPNKGKTWEVFETPIIQGKATTGMYSLDFYDVNNGFAIGGDYTKPDDNLANKMMTQDGGKTWQIVAEGKSPGYRSCVQYIPNSNAKGLVAVGFKGIDYSKDAGNTWIHLSDEPFYTISFANDSVAYAGGKGGISRLVFR
jgi:photosystem II stability/assembly factor-like uncharacterized protein